jgi:hypothetical protein
MYYLLLGSVLLEYDEYLLIHIFSIAISTLKQLGSGTNGSAV